MIATQVRLIDQFMYQGVLGVRGHDMSTIAPMP